MQERIAK